MARLNIGGKRVTQEQIEKWKAERGYDKPLYWNAEGGGRREGDRHRSSGSARSRCSRSTSAAPTRGRAVDIGHEIKTRMWVSLQLAVPLFILQVIASTAFALLLVFFRHTQHRLLGRGAVRPDAVDLEPVLHHRRPVLLLARAPAGADLGLRGRPRRGEVPAPADRACRCWRGSAPRRGCTARCSSRRSARTTCAPRAPRACRSRSCCSATCCSNALIPIITSAGSYLPYVFLGSLVFESFFGIPGLGAFVIEAIAGQDFAIVRSMVFVGALLYIASYIADRLRLHLGRPAGPARLMPPPACRKFVFLWTDVVLWAMLLGCSPGTSGGCGAAPTCAPPGTRCCAIRPPFCAAIVLAAVRVRDDARQRPLPARAGARARRRAGRDRSTPRPPNRCSTWCWPGRSRCARPPTRSRWPTRASSRSRWSATARRCATSRA